MNPKEQRIQILIDEFLTCLFEIQTLKNAWEDLDDRDRELMRRNIAACARSYGRENAQSFLSILQYWLEKDPAFAIGETINQIEKDWDLARSVIKTNK